MSRDEIEQRFQELSVQNVATVSGALYFQDVGALLDLLDKAEGRKDRGAGTAKLGRVKS